MSGASSRPGAAVRSKLETNGIDSSDAPSRSCDDPCIPRPETTGLYVHVPFCETKCGYCDFYSVAVKDRDTAPLLISLIRELESRTENRSGDIRTVFCGGGTPTILPIEQLDKLLQAIGRCVDAKWLDEFTVEANPATVDDAKAQLLIRRGVSRVSMGAQSFFLEELATLERLHAPDDIAPSVATLRRSGVPQINIDLIFGIPGQSMETWTESLRRTVELGPDHISCYGLTYEPATRLTALRATGRLTPCDEDLEAEMFAATVDLLDAAGYVQYETSNFARPGCECRHNLIYWRNQPYIGVGPSAAGCIDGRRYKNVSDVAGYVRLIDERGNAEVESEMIVGETLMLEMILMQLRLIEGLSIEDFKRRTGFDPTRIFSPTLSRLTEDGLVAVTDSHIALTRRGRLVSDRILAELAGAIGPLNVALPVLS